MNKKTYIAAMSGGVDSSVATHLYLKEGHEVIGVTLRMKPEINPEEDAQVKLVTDKLGIVHHFLDVRDAFREKVLKYSFDEYLRARTPNPCVMCNMNIKFGLLLDYAMQNGTEGVITGHYARIVRGNDGKTCLFKGIDDRKNQTYFLSMLTQQQISKSFMPLGDYTKVEVRKIAAGLNLPNAKKTESQDICFMENGASFASTMTKMFRRSDTPGNIVTEDGRIVGRHNGIQNFTIGQRKGTGVALGEPAYVKAIDEKTNTVIVCTDETHLQCSEFTAVGMNWLDFTGEKMDCEIQTRYRQQPQKAEVIKTGDNNVHVKLFLPLRAVTPGQTLAVYKGDQLIAGGWINTIKN